MDINEEFFYYKTKFKILKQDIEQNKLDLKKEQIQYDDLLVARQILNEAIKLTQDKFKGKVEFLVTLALNSTFQKRNFKFEFKSEKKRNRIEYTPVLMEDGEEYDDIEEDMGGSLSDIASYALRLIFQRLEKPKTRSVIFQDEPMKFCGNLIDLAGQVIKETSDELKTQIILVTHDERLMSIANKLFKIRNKNGISELAMLK